MLVLPGECALRNGARERTVQFRRDLRSLIEDVIKVATPGDSHDALNKILDFVKRLPADSEQTGRARFRPRIIAGRNALVPILTRMRGEALEKKTLEIISPYFDADNAKVVEGFHRRTRRESHVYPPTPPRRRVSVSSCVR